MGEKTDMSGKKRLNLVIGKESLDAMETLLARSSCSDLEQLIQRSLQVYDRFTGMLEGGTRLVAHHPDGTTEILVEKSL